MSITGNGPLEFTDANGFQVSIPLSALTLASGAIQVDTAIWTTALPSFVKDLVGELALRGLLADRAAPPAQPAIVITAADPGIAGNSITIDIAVTPAADGDPANATFDVTVTETKAYPGLTTATISGILGTQSAPAANPGLAHLVDGSLQAALLPDVQTKNLAGSPATANIDDTTPATVFTLEAKKSGAGGAHTKADISNVNAGAKTFTLTLTWTNTVNGAKLASMAADLAPLSYEISVGLPSSGIFSVPAATSAPVSLSGGTKSLAASAIFFAA